MPLLYLFLLYFANLINCNFYVSLSEFYLRRFSLFWLCFFTNSNSLSFDPFVLFILVTFKNFSSNGTIFSFSYKVFNHLCFTCNDHLIPSFSNLRISFIFCFFYFQHLIYKCFTICLVALYYQYFRRFYRIYFDQKDFYYIIPNF